MPGVEVTEMRLPPAEILSRALSSWRRDQQDIGADWVAASARVSRLAGKYWSLRRRVDLVATDSIIYDCAEEETSPKIRVRTLKLLSFPTDLADGGAYVEGL